MPFYLESPTLRYSIFRSAPPPPRRVCGVCLYLVYIKHLYILGSVALWMGWRASEIVQVEVMGRREICY